MRFNSRLPDEDVNVSRQHPAVEAIKLTVGIAGLLAIIILFTFTLIEVAMRFVSPQTESSLFSEWNFAELLPIDFEANEIQGLQGLTNRLSRYWPDTPYTFTIGVLNDPRPNALALPGGTIAVTIGLLDQLDTENALAFVIAHEIGHFRNRDHLRMLGRGVALGLLLMTVSGNDAGLVSSGVIDLTSRSFSRQQETAADTWALEIVDREYGHVAGALGFFEELLRSEATSSRLGSYLTTHPATDNRVEQLEELANERGWETDGRTRPLNW